MLGQRFLDFREGNIRYGPLLYIFSSFYVCFAVFFVNKIKYFNMIIEVGVMKDFIQILLFA